MWDKIKEICKKVFVYGIWVQLILGLIFIYIYIPVKCTEGFIDGIQNPPSEIYAENQVFDKWKSYCIDSDRDNCYAYGSRLITKSYMYVDDDEIDIVSVIEVDEYNTQMSITMRDWNTGDVIQPFPQIKHKWYEFYKSYDFYESVGFLLNDKEEDEMGYELTVYRNGIIIDDKSCNSKGYEEQSNIQGGCFFLEHYNETLDEWHSLYVEFKNDFSVVINL